jgi:hypothetical protein
MSDYTLILSPPEGGNQWQLNFSMVGSHEMVKAYSRQFILREKFLRDYNGPITLYTDPQFDEPPRVICVFDLKHQRSVIGGE